RSHLVLAQRIACRRIEAGLEPSAELREVLVDAPPGVPRLRILDRDRDQRRAQQPLYRRRLVGELHPLALVERLEDRPDEVIGEPVELCALAAPLRCELRDPNPAVVSALVHDRQSLRFERAEQAAEVAGVESETMPQIAHLAAERTDLPQEPRLAERPVSA